MPNWLFGDESGKFRENHGEISYFIVYPFDGLLIRKSEGLASDFQFFGGLLTRQTEGLASDFED